MIFRDINKDINSGLRMGILFLTIVLCFIFGCAGKSVEKGTAVADLHFPGKIVEVNSSEGNLLLPGNLYQGDWIKSQWYTFKFTLKKMTAMQLLATNENPSGGGVDLKVSRKGFEFFTSMTAPNPAGPHRIRLPAGSYKVTIVISVEGNPQKAGKWTLSVKPIKGAEAFKIDVPSKLLRKIQKKFPNGIHRLAFPPDSRPEFDFIMSAWLWNGMEKNVVYTKGAQPIYPFDASMTDVTEGRGAILKLLPGEPVIVYGFVDIVGVRVYTADGLDGIIDFSSVVKEAPPQINLPESIRLAPPNLRKVAPYNCEIQRNGGILTLMYHPSFKRYINSRKVKKCLKKVTSKHFSKFYEAFSDYSVLFPWNKDVVRKGESVEIAWKGYETARDSCFAGIWERIEKKGGMTRKDKTEALFLVLNEIRKRFGLEEVPVPVNLPAILPSPPAPQPPPQPAQPSVSPQPSQPVPPAQPQPASEPAAEVIGPQGTISPAQGQEGQVIQPQQGNNKKNQPQPWGQPQGGAPTPNMPLPSGSEEVIGPSG